MKPEQLRAMVEPHLPDNIKASQINWANLLSKLPQLIALILSAVNPSGTTAPAPAPAAGEAKPK